MLWAKQQDTRVVVFLCRLRKGSENNSPDNCLKKNQKTEINLTKEVQDLYNEKHKTSKKKLKKPLEYGKTPMFMDCQN
jgi:hypothetical protein